MGVIFKAANRNSLTVPVVSCTSHLCLVLEKFSHVVSQDLPEFILEIILNELGNFCCFCFQLCGSEDCNLSNCPGDGINILIKAGRSVAFKCRWTLLECHEDKSSSGILRVKLCA